jgi:hypothetical protein
MAVGVSVSQPPVTLVKTADAISQKHFRPVLVDGIFKPSPSWWRISRLGRKIQGGSAIVLPIAYQEENTGGSYWGANILDTSLTDSVQPAEWQWRRYYQAIVIPYTDLLFNSGPTGVVDLVKAKEEIAMASLLQKLSRALYDVSPQNTSTDIDSLVDGVVTTNNTYGGIDRSVAANAFWISGNASGPTTLGANLSLSAMQTEYGKITFGNEEPDTILTTQNGFNAYWNLLVGNIRYERQDEETVRAGFKRHLMFNNAVVLHDQFTPAGYMYFLNSKYICPYFHQDDYFTIDPFLKPSNQRILVSNIFLTMQLLVKNPRMQSAIASISNA